MFELFMFFVLRIFFVIIKIYDLKKIICYIYGLFYIINIKNWLIRLVLIFVIIKNRLICDLFFD